jgi:hypothetical protein
VCILTNWGEKRGSREESRNCGLRLKHIYIYKKKKKNTKKIGIWSDDGESKLSSSRRVSFLGFSNVLGG